MLLLPAVGRGVFAACVMRRIQIAARDFAVPVPRRGSIETHSGYELLPQSGDEAHRLAQKKRAAEIPAYKPEVKLSHSFERDGYTFIVSGRADGIVDGAKGKKKITYIEEIKTAFDAKDLYAKLHADPAHPYCLQLLTYGYIYSVQNANVPALGLHIASYASDDVFDLSLLLNVREYEAWLDKRLDELVAEARYRDDQRARRQAVSESMKFPFKKPRSKQVDLIDAIERTMLEGDSLILQAPTGLGKTAGVIFPTLREALSRGQKLVYVTPKNSQHQVAEDAVKRLQKDGSDIRALTLTAKSKLCFKGEPVCNPEHCEFARDYYQKVAENNLVEKATQESNMNGAHFQRLGEQYEVCPFELSIDCIQRADVVIGDYNYVFAPRGLLGRLTGYQFGDNEKPNLVIDEAHNLPARAADYFSPSVGTWHFDACRDRLDSLPLDVRSEGFAMLNLVLAALKHHEPRTRTKEAKIELDVGQFRAVDERLAAFMNIYLKETPNPKLGDPILALCREWSAFTELADAAGDNFFFTYKRDTSNSMLKITCCDASEQLSQCLKEFEHSVAFSATLKPFEYYRQLCGFTVDKVRTIEFSSPFPKNNRKLLVIPQVSTKYNDRDRNYPKIAEAIERIVSVQPGNYFVFFPSFAFLRSVYERVKLPNCTVLHQTPGMSAAEVEKYVAALRDAVQPTVIFAVQGGVFSEGVDYPGNMLIGAIIVGPALPGYDLERELLREYYERKFGQGFDYAYTYPAMARVIQAAGRVIRSEEDRGVIVLMDRRFTAPAYAATMPSDWFEKSVNELVSMRILQDIQQFWKEGHPSESA
jgi:DNA excision repair protein ERCC-2